MSTDKPLLYQTLCVACFSVGVCIYALQIPRAIAFVNSQTTGKNMLTQFDS
ncbi:hypothetical protein [Nostoc sp.]|uniref:hypothetical protein n=1 Tax=Nostoc sp. TaxID=1180 RepID=UPI002FFBD6CD